MFLTSPEPGSGPWGKGSAWQSIFITMLAEKISTRPDARSLAHYLYAHLVVPLRCRYVALVQASEWVDPTEWGACRDADHIATPWCETIKAVCDAVRLNDGSKTCADGCIYVRPLDRSRMLWLAVGVPCDVEDSAVREVLDLVAPVLSFYARSETSNLRRPSPAPEATPFLTPRQGDIVELIAQGLTNASIARRIGFSESLVRHEIMAIFKIFGSRTRAEAVLAARRSGLLPLALSS